MKIPARQLIPVDQWDNLTNNTGGLIEDANVELTNLQAWELCETIQKQLYAQFPQDNILDFRREIYNHLTKPFLEKLNHLSTKEAVEEVAANHKAAKKMVECARECEALSLNIWSEKMRLIGTSALGLEELREMRNYVPIPPSAYISDEQELKSRPNRSQHERLNSVRKEKSAAPKTESDKRIKQIADLMYSGDVDKARKFIESGGEL